MTSPGSYLFGVEIELIAEPRVVQHPLIRQAYYTSLAASLQSCGLNAIADKLDERYRKHPEHFTRWWITKDGSLGSPRPPYIPMEAVSPVLCTDFHWEDDIDTFWDAANTVFRGFMASRQCGSHVHISPSPGGKFGLSQLRCIAFGVVFYEPLIQRLLPRYRQSNEYCLPNTQRSSQLRAVTMKFGEDAALRIIWVMIVRADNWRCLRDLMQEGPDESRERYVVWNFDNIRYGGSGTIEFRGGPYLRCSWKTKRWISFAVAFIHLCLTQDFTYCPDYSRPSMERFWQQLLEAADCVCVKSNLPLNWGSMGGNEPNE